MYHKTVKGTSYHCGMLVVTGFDQHLSKGQIVGYRCPAHRIGCIRIYVSMQCNDVSTIQNIRIDGGINMYTFTHVGVQYLLMSAPLRMSELMLANSRLYVYISSRLPARKEWTQPTRPKSTPTRSKILEQYKGHSYLSWQSAVQYIKPMYDGRKCVGFLII